MPEDIVEAFIIGGAAVLGAVIALASAHLTDRRAQQRWFREKLTETYSGAVYYLAKLAISAGSDSIEHKDVRQHRSETVRYLSLLLAFTPLGAQHRNVQASLAAINAAVDAAGLVRAAETGRTNIEAILRQDQRVVIA